MFIHFHCRTTQPQKSKFALVVAVETQCAIALLINSEPSEFILSKPDLLNQQLQLFAHEWPFLQYDSWLDCSSAHIFNEEDIATVRHVGDSSAALRNQVVQIAQTSRTLNRRTKTAVANLCIWIDV
jgi:hypothetical protein